MSNPFEPVANDAKEAKLVELSWNGLTFTAPGDPKDLPVRTLKSFEDGRAANSVALLLGDEQFAQFENAGATVRDIETLMEQWTEAVGITVGE